MSAVNGWFDITVHYTASTGALPAHNDAQITQALLDMANPAMNPTKTGVLYIPPGTFRVSTTFTVTSGIMIRGAGTTVSTISQTVLNQDVFQTAGGAAGVSFVGLKVHFTNDNTASTQNGIAISLRGASEARIIDVLVDDPGTAFQIGGVATGCSGVYVTRTNASCSKYTNYGLNVPGFQSSELHFTGFKLGGGGPGDATNSICGMNFAACSNVFIAGSDNETFQTCLQILPTAAGDSVSTVLMLNASFDVAIDNCATIGITAGSGGVMDVRIANSFIGESSSLSGTSLLTDSLQISGPTSTTVPLASIALFGTHFQLGTRADIALGQCDHVLIVGCGIYQANNRAGALQAGIALQNISHVVMMSNIVSCGTTTSINQQYGIYATGTAKNVQALGCDLSTTTNPLDIAGLSASQLSAYFWLNVGVNPVGAYLPGAPGTSPKPNNQHVSGTIYFASAQGAIGIGETAGTIVSITAAVPHTAGIPLGAGEYVSWASSPSGWSWLLD